MAWSKYQILFILYQIVVMLCHWFCEETSQFELDKYFYSFFFSWKLPYFSIAHLRNFGHVTSLIGHDPFCVCEIKPQPHLTTTSKYGGHISNNKVCRFICSSSPEVTISTKNQLFFISPQKWLDRSTRFCLFFPKLLGDGVGMLSYLCCNESSQFQLENYFYSYFFSENYHILALRRRGISVKWRH